MPVQYIVPYHFIWLVGNGPRIGRSLEHLRPTRIGEALAFIMMRKIRLMRC